MNQRGMLCIVALTVILLAPVVFAEDPPAAQPTAADGGAAAEKGGTGKMGHGHMGMGMMGKGGHGHMEGGCPMMGASAMHAAGMGGGLLAEPGVDLKVDKRDDGVVLTLTSKDTKAVRRLQKRAEIMRLMHELRTEDAAGPAE